MQLKYGAESGIKHYIIYDTALKIEIKILRCRNEKNPPTMQVYYFYAKKLY